MGLFQKRPKIQHTHKKKEKKNWIQTLALEAETAITQLPTNEGDVYR